MRTPQLKQGYIYHIFTKSIAGFNVFRTKDDYLRFVETIKFYRFYKPPTRLSAFLGLKNKDRFVQSYMKDLPQLVDILAYCIMPTHFHLLLVQLMDGGISLFMKHILDSYSRYFNTKNNRKGPLWQGRFKHVLIETEEQFMHTTRYIHLNPTTDFLVERPEYWQFSSYKEYIGLDNKGICNFKKYYPLVPEEYRKFVEAQIQYQQELKHP